MRPRSSRSMGSRPGARSGGPWPLARWRAGLRVVGADAVERLACRSGFFAARREVDHLLPRIRGPLEVLLAERTHDADVQHRLCVFRIDREGVLELLERLVGVVLVVVRDAEIGADVDVL